MPPSPARRFSPGRELRAEVHKRGRSLEGGLLFRDKDEDLMLFKEMQTRERDNFLLQSDDDFEYSFSTKLGHFSDPKLGITIPGKGQNSELLNVEGEKNDYDWLLTPPDTPLFRSLDDETLPITAPRRGRPRSQSISVSRSSTMERSYRSNRGSASPSRSSKSPQSSSSVSQSMGIPSSARHASPTPSHNHSTRPNRASPSNRATPSLSKPSSPGVRSSTPSSRRLSSGSGAALGSLMKGMSPAKTSRGSSASPKIQSRQSNIPAFPSDTPPNLCTSVSEHPASYVRGTSPASRYSQDSASNVGRRSMSPTASRCITSYSQDRDQLSSHSKGSGGYGDDDVDTLQSAYVGSLDRSTFRKFGASPSKKEFSTSKKRVAMSTSAPKRSFDSALRQMDHRKSPQNMFRPLLSSIPGSTFYDGKSGPTQGSIISGNSLVMTNSDITCDHGMALNMEEGKELHGGLASENVEEIHSGMEPDIFEFDNEDMMSERDMENRLADTHLDEFNEDPLLESNQGDDQGYIHSGMLVEMAATSEASCGSVDLGEIFETDKLLACSICGDEYDASGYSEREGEICPECHRKGQTLKIAVSGSGHVLTEHAVACSVGISEKSIHLDQLKSLTASSEAQEIPRVCEQTVITEESCRQQSASSLENSLKDACKAQLAKEEEIPPTISESEQLDAMSKRQMLSQMNEFAKADKAISISVLLTRSSSINGPVIQGQTIASSVIPRDDLSYARDSTNSMKSSYGRDSVSGSSSADLGRSHSRSLKSNIDGQRYDLRSQSMGSSFSGASENVQRGFGAFASELGDFENSVDNGEDNSMEGTVTTLEQVHHMDSNSDSKMRTGNSTQSLEYAARIGSDDDVAVRGGVGDSGIHEDARSQVGQIIEDQNHLDSSISDKDDTSSMHSALSKSAGLPDIERTVTGPELTTSYPSDHALEESTVMVETQAGIKAKSLTLEEATDTILFCRSIVHDLAYKVATMAIEKEGAAPLEVSHPTVTILGKSTGEAKDPPRRGRIRSKRAMKTQKPRPRQVEMDKKGPTFHDENDENINKSLTRNIGLSGNLDAEKPPKLESKCNCTIM